MPTIVPVLFFAFANDRRPDGVYLRNLPDEARQLQRSLEIAAQSGQCEIVVQQNATLDDILRIFHDPRYYGRIVHFHYGGHAESFGLLLETVQGEVATAHAEGLTSFLGRQRGLQLVFLNGCSTQAQSKLLLDAGIPLVIATDQAIDDAIATEFAAHFYQALAGGNSVGDGFANAGDAIQTKIGSDPRNIKLLWHTSSDASSSGEPWSLYTQPDGVEAKSWQLATATNDPYFGLPDLPQEIGLPDIPFLGLNRFERQHARIFFGRGWVIRELFLHLTHADSDPLLLFYGQTGVGKSSLLDAGLLPRLEQSHTVIYQRRTPSEGLLGGLSKALGVAVAEVAELGKRWCSLEAMNGRPLTVLLDQVEEAFTQPYSGDKWPMATPPDATTAQAELAILMTAVYDLFTDAAERPQGKLILSFRKEHLAEIVDAVKATGIDHTAYFLKPLDRFGIQEAVIGVAGGKSLDAERLRTKYKLKIENAEELAPKIADDLLVDKESPIAVTLQILLTEMWQAAVEVDRSRPRFTETLYEARRKAGLLLNNFLDRQQTEVAEQFPEPSKNGLVLDLLYHHTTELGTAQEHTKDELAQLYPHRKAILPALLQCLTDSYLLVDASADQSARTGILRLAHDTLAPLVRLRFDSSTLPGQRAYHLLRSRVGTPDNPRPDPVPLDDVDLRLVEEGQNSMRRWHDKEEKLVQQSQKARKQRKRRRNLLQWTGVAGLVVIAVLGIVSIFLAIQANREAENARIAQAKAEENSELANQQLARLEVEQLVQKGRELKATCAVAEAIAAFENAAAKDTERGEEMAAEIGDTRRQCATQLVRQGEQLAAQDDYEGAAAKFQAALALDPPSDTPLYVWIAGGQFLMGSNDDDERAYDDERPQHKVELQGFWLQRTEVTNAQFRRCVEQGPCASPSNQRWPLDQFANQPVTNVNWHQANAYANWVGGRLPTEAEWEHACRGSDGRIYPWGNEDADPSRLNYWNSGLGTWTSVGSYPAGANGLYDMGGNVWEWTSSQYRSYPYDASDGREEPEGDNSRTLRGSSFSKYSYVVDDVRCADRFYLDPDFGNDNFGFRVAVSPGF